MKKIPVMILAILMICLFVPATTVWADQTFYVDATNGNDGNDGSESAPLKTLTQAITNAGSTPTTIILLSDMDNVGTHTIGDSSCRSRIETPTVYITLNLNGHEIVTYEDKGAIFNVFGNAEFTMCDTVGGGIIKNVIGSNTQGMHGVEVLGVFNLRGGTISCTLKTWPGGGVCLDQQAIFNMYGGAITDCSAGTGGAVYVGYENPGGSTFNMYGGTISNCSATTGGGVYVDSTRPAYVTLGGNAKITGNTGGNLYLSTGKTVTLDNPGSGMSVGVTMQTPGTITSNSAYDYKNCFSSDNGSYSFGYDSDNKLILGSKLFDITYKDKDDAGFSGTHESGYPTEHISGAVTKLKGARKSGYTFDGWYKESDCSGTSVTQLTDADSGSSTLYAKWTKSSSSDEPKKDDEEFTEEEIRLLLESLRDEANGKASSDEKKADIEKSNKKTAEKGKEKNKSIYPSKSLISNTIVDLKQTYDIKALDLSKRDDVNQQFLANYTAASHGKKAKIIANCGIYPNRDLSITENGSLQILTWSNLSYKTPGNVYAICYNQTDGVYVIGGTIDSYGTARLINYRLRPATNITVYVEY